MARWKPAAESRSAPAAAGLAGCCLPASAAEHAAPNSLAGCGLPVAARTTDCVANRSPGCSTVVGCCSAWSDAGATGCTANVLLCRYRAIQRGWHAGWYGGAAIHDRGGGGRSCQWETHEVPTYGYSDYGRVGSTALLAGLLSHHPPLLTVVERRKRSVPSQRCPGR